MLIWMSNSHDAPHQHNYKASAGGIKHFHLSKCWLAICLTMCYCFLQVEIHHASEIDSIFDSISYDKGASVIRMLQSYLGAERFQVLYLSFFYSLWVSFA